MEKLRQEVNDRKEFQSGSLDSGDHSLSSFAHSLLLGLGMGWDLPHPTDLRLGLRVLNPRKELRLKSQPQNQRAEKNFTWNSLAAQWLRLGPFRTKVPWSHCCGPGFNPWLGD